MKKKLFTRGAWPPFVNSKTERIMKLLFLFLLSGLVQVSANSYSQSSRLNLELQNVEIREVLQSIESQSKFRFAYSSEYVNLDQRVNVSIRDKNITETLQHLFEGTGIRFEIQDRLIMLYGKEEAAAVQQNRKAEGTVSDNTNMPLPGVTVVVKGTRQGTVTDLNGKFSFAAVPDGASLVFSFVGMKTQEVPVAGTGQINVRMEEESFGIGEVVAVGYGTQKRENLTGAVSTVNAESLDSRPVTNVAQALQGMVPGLNIVQGGTLGGSLENRPSVNIRGVGTIGQGSKGTPLILIDGIEADINALNPQDIDNISVLKDAAASSIYGSRAPFGVVLVTTKKGKTGKSAFSINANLRSSGPVLLPRMMDSYTFALYFNDARFNSGQGAYFTDERMQRIKDYQEGKITTTIVPRPGQPNLWGDGYFEGNDNVDWYRAIYKTRTPSQEYSVSASGGGDDVTYYLGGSYLDQTGLMKFGGDSFKRYSSTAKINAQLTSRISVEYIGRFVREEFERPSRMTNTLNQNISRQGWPVLPLYDNNGYLYDAPSPALALRDGGRDFHQDDDLIQQLKMTIEPSKGWKILADFNYSISNNLRHWDLQYTYNHDVAGNPYIVGKSSEVHEVAYRKNYSNSNIYSEYSRSFGNHHLKILAGMQSELTKTREFVAEREGLIVPSLPVIDLTSGTDFTGKTVPPFVSGENQHWSIAGYFGRINYNYKERYLIEANLRYDGSSRFRSSKRWTYSPSASVGWNMSREEFWKSLVRYVNTLKIRGSYGVLSNQNTSNWYPTYSTMPIGISDGAWLVNGAKPNTASAPYLISSALTWEKVRTWNLGADIGFLDNRFSCTFDLFSRFTDNMIGPAPELPIILGTAVPKTNNTDLKTYGFELELAWKDRLANGLSYNVRLILSDAKTKITKYPNPTGKLYNYKDDNGNLHTYLAGHMMGEIWGYETIGIAKTQEEMDTHLASLPDGGQNALGSNWKAGDLMFKDLNNDDKINDGAGTAGDHGDWKVIGNDTPRYLFGLDLTVNWKGFDFRSFFQGVMKRDYFQNSFYFWGASTTIYSSAGLKEHGDYFRDDPEHPLGMNLDSYYPRPLLSNKNQRVQTRYLQDASYIRLKNIQIGYTIPSLITRKAGLQKLRVYISGENLWTLTDMKGMFDPETIDGGWGGSVYPLSKVYAVGLNITL
ncbi:MAG: TonB-dependent receptor [Mangrovibacterium sp.]